jgi:hypothetical protein
VNIDLSKFPPEILFGVVVVLAILVLLIPIALRIAGLTGQQITDTISLTLQFFVNIVREFRAQNKQE